VLLEKGAELESKDNKIGGTPLLWASVQGHSGGKAAAEKGAKLEPRPTHDTASEPHSLSLAPVPRRLEQKLHHRLCQILQHMTAVSDPMLHP